MGVAVIVAITGLLSVFTLINEAILPMPLAAKPVLGALLTQLKVFAIPVKLIAVVAAPFKTIWFCCSIYFVGNAFTVPATATLTLVPPG